MHSAKSQRSVLTILWLALLASIGLYVAVAYLAVPAPGEDAELPEAIAIVLTIAAVVAAAMSFWLPRFLLSDATLRRHMSQDSADLPPADAPADAPAGQEPASDHDRRLCAAATLYFVPWVVGAVLAESVAIYGLVLAFLAQSPELMLPYAAAAAAILLIKRPRYDALLRRAAALAR